MGWLRRKADDSMDAQALLAQAHASNPLPGPAGGFRLTVGDVFSIRGRGTVVTGQVEAGSVRVGDTVHVNGAGQAVSVDGIEMFRKTVDTAGVGDNVGLLVRQLRREDVDRGDVLSN
jgi:translation elongation factor EF-Tu-like GTPase